MRTSSAPDRAASPLGGGLIDVDLVIGRDVPTGRWATISDIGHSAAAMGITNGIISSLRATYSSVPAGNEEASEAGASLGFAAATTVDLRDPLNALHAIDAASSTGQRFIRLAPTAQGAEPGFPGFRRVARHIAEQGLITLLEGDLRSMSTPFLGSGATLVFLDAHFYHLGDAVILGEEEPGFLFSTRCLTGPRSIEALAGALGAHRLVFGSRAPLQEGLAAIRQLEQAQLPATDIAQIASGTISRVLA